MKYVLKVADYDTFVKSYSVDSQAKDNHVNVTYTANHEEALTFDDVSDATLHLVFIYANASSKDVMTNSLCIAEAQTYYKEL